MKYIKKIPYITLTLFILFIFTQKDTYINKLVNQHKMDLFKTYSSNPIYTLPYLISFQEEYTLESSKSFLSRSFIPQNQNFNKAEYYIIDSQNKVLFSKQLTNLSIDNYYNTNNLDTPRINLSFLPDETIKQLETYLISKNTSIYDQNTVNFNIGYYGYKTNDYNDLVITDVSIDDWVLYHLDTTQPITTATVPFQYYLSQIYQNTLKFDSASKIILDSYLHNKENFEPIVLNNTNIKYYLSNSININGHYFYGIAIEEQYSQNNILYVFEHPSFKDLAVNDFNKNYLFKWITYLALFNGFIKIFCLIYSNRSKKQIIEKQKIQLTQIENYQQLSADSLNNELKTSLSVITGFIELLNNETDELKKAHYLQTIQNEANGIIEKLISYEDLNSLKNLTDTFNPIPTDLSDCILNAVDDCTSLFKYKQLKVDLLLDEVNITADSKKIEIAIRSLLQYVTHYAYDESVIHIQLNSHQFNLSYSGEILSDSLINLLLQNSIPVDEYSYLGDLFFKLIVYQTILDLHHFTYNIIKEEKTIKFIFNF